MDLEGVRVLCLDAGNTVIFLDHARIAAWLEGRGLHVTREALVRGEGVAKRRQEEGRLLDVRWSAGARPGARGWAGMTATMLHAAGAPIDALPELLDGLWEEHVRWNLYSRVPEGLGAALDAARARGAKVAIVSNSEGMLEELFAALGVLSHFDVVADSGKLGVAKPDPRIFEHALAALGARASEAIHLGDSIATDVAGARAAGVRPFLVDPFGHCEGRALDVPRVAGVVELASALRIGR